jgi:hypothetical protein
VDAGALDDPVGIEAQALVEMIIGNDRIRHIASGCQNAQSREASTAWSWGWGTFFIHVCYTNCC